MFSLSSDINPCHSLYFSRDHSRSTSGIISGRSLTAPVLNSSVNAGFLSGRKNPLYYSAQSASSRSTDRFVCSNTKPTQRLVHSPYLSCLFVDILLEKKSFVYSFSQWPKKVERSPIMSARNGRKIQNLHLSQVSKY